eukprot:7888-Amphidinium_carterae.1
MVDLSINTLDLVTALMEAPLSVTWQRAALWHCMRHEVTSSDGGGRASLRVSHKLTGNTRVWTLLMGADLFAVARHLSRLWVVHSLVVAGATCDEAESASSDRARVQSFQAEAAREHKHI